MEYIIDGTNICNVNGERSLTPLFTIALALLDRNASFICYFDYGTKTKCLAHPNDKAIYEKLTILALKGRKRAKAKFGNGYFFQTIQRQKADELILERAKYMPHAYVISNDLFRQEQYNEEYNWSELDREERLCHVSIVNREVRLIRKNKIIFSKPNERDILKLGTALINRLEEENGMLEGQIKSYDVPSKLGQIELKDKRIVYFRASTVNNEEVDYMKEGLDVKFNITHHINQNNQLYFQATDLQVIESAEEKLGKLQKDYGNLESNFKEAIAEIEDLRKENDGLRLIEMENERLKAKIKELQISGNTEFEKTIDNLIDANDELELEVQKLEKQNETQKYKIDTLKAKIHELETELEKYKSALRSKENQELFGFESPEENSLEGVFSIYDEKDHLQAKSEPIRDTNQRFYETKIYQLEREVKQLKAELESLYKKNSGYYSRMKTISKYGYEGFLGYHPYLDFAGLNQSSDEELRILHQRIRILQEKLDAAYSKFGGREDIKEEILPVDPPDNSALSDERNTAINPSGKRIILNTHLEDDVILDWWHNLTAKWRNAFEIKFEISNPLNKVEELYKIFDNKTLKLFGSDMPVSFLALPFVLEDVSGLSVLHELEEINLSYNRITNIDGLGDLNKLKKLKKLTLINNRIERIENLSEFPALEFLDISSNLIPPEEVEVLRKRFPEIHIVSR